MNDLIDFPGGNRPPAPLADGARSRVICDKPLRMRWGDWRTRHALQVHLQTAAAYEDYRAECVQEGRDPAGQIPPGFTLDGGMHHTALALLRYKADEESQRDVGYLAALMEALLNTPCDILRTDLIRRVYQEVEQTSNRLGLRWAGQAGHFMLPLNEDAREPQSFARRVAPLDNLKDFFATLHEIADQRHESLKKGYVIYYPHKGSL